MTADPHCWKTPQAPRGMPPSAWPAKRRELYVKAIKGGDPTAPKPAHGAGECSECDLMRDLMREDRRDQQAQEPVVAALAAAGGPSWFPEGWSPAIQRLGGIRAFPGAVALLLGMMAGIGLCTILGPAFAVALVFVFAVIAVIAAY